MLDGDLGGVEAHQDYVEVVFEIVGEGVHGFRFVLCLSTWPLSARFFGSAALRSE